MSILMRMSKTVKYNGEAYPANIDIPVDESHVQQLLDKGAWMVEVEPSPDYTYTQEQQEEIPVQEDIIPEQEVPQTETEITMEVPEITEDKKADQEEERKELMEYAKALDIPVRSNWGIPKLKKEIKIAESK